MNELSFSMFIYNMVIMSIDFSPVLSKPEKDMHFIKINKEK